MKTVELKDVNIPYEIGGEPGDVEPNLFEDAVFVYEGEPIGFYLKEVKGKTRKLLEVANREFNSKRVPKSTMVRSAAVMKGYKEEGKRGTEGMVEQYSTIIGAIPPRPHMKRDYPNISSVHREKSARNYIKAMVLLARESEKIIEEITPGIYREHKKLLEKTSQEWKLSDLYTSSISNYNIAAAYHRDTGNVKGSVNVIYTKRKNSRGGCLHVPDYGICAEQADNSMLVYPAWRNVHGVTPIKKLSKEGYRNTLIFYALAAFEKYS